MAEATSPKTPNVDATLVLHSAADGGYSLSSVSRSDIQRIDISDVDLLVTTKDGSHYLIPGGGIAAMSDHPPTIVFADGAVSAADLLGEVGAALDLAQTTPMPASFKTAGAKEGGASGNEQALAQKLHKLEQQNKQQQQTIQHQQKQIDEQHKHDQADKCADNGDPRHVANHSDHADCNPQKETHQQVAPLNLNTSMNVEQMVQNLEKLEDQLHNKDYDYIPPATHTIPSAPPSPPPGVPPPISLTPLVTLFMGNVIGTTVDSSVNPGYTTYYGGGGATGSSAVNQIGPRDALQWSAATITGDNGNDIIYAEGPLVGNTNPAVSNSANYAKEFILNVAGYFTTLNDITIKNVPSGVSIVGAIDQGGGTWILPSSYVIKQNTFTIVYSTANYDPSGNNNTFTIEFDVSGTSTHNSPFSSVQTVEFRYMNVTNSSQVTDPTLVYDAGGYTKEIYILPTLDQPNIITAGDGNDQVYGSRSNDTITLGNGNDQVTDGNGNNTITLGSGNSTITSGDGNNTIQVGDGVNSITVGNGNNSVTVGSGGDTVSAGSGDNTITVSSANGTTNLYTISTAGSGTNHIIGGDGDYSITMGNGANSISIGNSTSTGDGTTTFDSTIIVGTGSNNITTGSGVHSITTGGGGGTISTGSGNQKITINSSSGSNKNYNITTTGTGNTILTAGDNKYTIVASNSGANTISIGAGTSTITATTGTGLDSITTGNGNMTIAAGDGAGDNVTVGNSGAIANTVSVAVGNGAGDSVTLVGNSSSTGSVAVGSGNNDTIHVDSGSYTIVIGGPIGLTNTLTMTSGSGSSLVAGDGTNIIYVGSHASGTDTLTLGNGSNIVYVGTGTDTFTAGVGSNILNFTNLASGLTISFGTTGTSTATGTGISDSFTGFSTIYGTNFGDTITLNTGNLTVHAGSGNDIITLGSGTDTVYGGNGNNSIIGTGLTTSTNDFLYGGTGNNIYTNPDAGSFYNATNGAALTANPNNLAFTFTNTSASNPFASAGSLPADLGYSYSGGTATINLYLQTQINEVDYSLTGGTAMSVNLAIGAGSGSGGAAAGSFYIFTPTPGYSTINAVIANNLGDTLTPSYDETILIGGTVGDVFQDGNTLASQTVILVGDGKSSGSGTDVYFAGPASEIIVASKFNGSQLGYGWSASLANASNSAGIVVNLDNSSHTFSNTLLSGNVTIAAYSGNGFGAVTATSTGSSTYGLNAGTSSQSWANGDYYVPVIGTSTNISAIMGDNFYTNVVYGGTGAVTFYAGGSGSHGNFFFAGSGGSQYQMNGGWGAAVVLTAGGTNVFTTHNDAYNNTNYNMFVILNKALDSGSQGTKDSGVNLTWGGTTYTGFAYGWGNVNTPVGNPLTYLSGYENIAGYLGNDYIVGDNNNDQINARSGSNTIILGNATNIVTAIEGSNAIFSSSSAGQTIGTNTLNFEVNNDATSGVLGTYSGAGANTSAEAFLVYSGTSVQSTFFSAGGDTTAFFGSSALASAFQARTGTSSFLYSSVQTGIITTLNGSDYTTNTSVTPGSNSSFVFDNVYSGAQSIIGHAGNDIFIDNIGTASQTFNGSADKNNAYYITGAQISHVTITGGGTGIIDALRIEGAAPADLSTLVTNSAKYTGIDVVDLRTGVDSINTTTNTITMGAGSTAQANAFSLTEANMESLTHVASGGAASLILKLDSGDTFTATPSGGVTITHSTSAYYGDIYTYTNNGTHTVTTLNIHYGTS